MNIKKSLALLTALTGWLTMTAQVRPIIPLEYVAEYSLGTNTQTGAFATSHRNDSCGWYKPAQAQKVMPAGYHIPSEDELYSILPQRDTKIWGNKGSISFGCGIINDYPESCAFGGVKGTYTGDYNGPKDNLDVIYAIRFIGNGNKYRCAYRYEKHGHFATRAGYGDRKSYLMVQAKYIGPSGSVTLDDVSKEAYWQTTGDIVTRIFPANGKHKGANPFDGQLGGMISILGKSGTWISGNLFEYDKALGFWRFQGNYRNDYLYGGSIVVRPFLDKLPAEPLYDKEPPMVHPIYTANVENRPPLPIDYLADFSVGSPQWTCDITDPNADGGQYQRGTFTDKIPAGYHMPTLREWCGIFPEYIYLQNDDMNYEDTEQITVNGKTSVYKTTGLAFWLGTKYYINYALKFIDETNELLSAYKYEFDKKKYCMRVSCRYLGPAFKGNVHELAYPEFWMTEDVITVELPVTNNVYNGNDYKSVFGIYQVRDDSEIKNYTVGSTHLGIIKAQYFMEAQGVIRPFKNSLKPKTPAKPGVGTKSATANKAPVRRPAVKKPVQRKK